MLDQIGNGGVINLDGISLSVESKQSGCQLTSTPTQSQSHPSVTSATKDAREEEEKKLRSAVKLAWDKVSQTPYKSAAQHISRDIHCRMKPGSFSSEGRSELATNDKEHAEAIRSFAEAHMKLAVWIRNGNPDSVSIGLPPITKTEKASSYDLSEKDLLGYQGSGEEEDEATVTAELFADRSTPSATPSSIGHPHSRPEQSMVEGVVRESSPPSNSPAPTAITRSDPESRRHRLTIEHALRLDRQRSKTNTVTFSDRATTSTPNRSTASNIRHKIEQTTRRWIRRNP